MSRTYRRKGKVPEWSVSDWSYDRSISGMFIRILYTGKELKKAEAIYHADNRKSVYMGSIPAWFRRDFGHKWDRQSTRRSLHKELYALDRGDVVFDKPRNIDWQWW